MRVKSKELSGLALRLLSLREHTRVEISRKLMQRGFSSEAVSELCSEFVEKGYVDDDRVARMCLDTALSVRNKGPGRFREELLHRGLNAELVSAVVSEYARAIDEHALAEEWATKLVMRGKDSGYVKRFLFRKGFTTSVIIGVVEKLNLDNDCSSS